MAKAKDFILNQTNTAYVMGVSTQAFLKWNIEADAIDGNEKYYDLRRIVGIRTESLKSGTGNLTKQRVLKEQTLAAKAKIELDLLKGKLVKIKIVEDIWSDQIIASRSVLLSIPKLISKNLINRTKAEIERELTTEIHRALRELADDNIYKDEEEDQETVATTKQNKRKRVG
jgi:hypothetical protein